MASELLPIEELSPFGVRVDFDLMQDFGADVEDALRDLLWNHHLLVFTNQALEFERQVRVMSLFGPLERGDRPEYVSKDAKIGNTAAVELSFHHDLAESPIPMVALSLYGFDIEPGTTSTMFLDVVKAYRDLPDDLKQRVEGLDALQVLPMENRLRRVRSTTTGKPLDERLPMTLHPVVMVHPKSGERLLFVNEMETDHIAGIAPEESEELIEALFADMYRPEHVFEHWWNEGDLVIWDNLAVQHGRREQSHVDRRTLRRVVCAERSIWEQNPQLVLVNGHADLAE
jgi:taurine dioxygenase